MYDKNEKLNEVINSERLEPEFAMNILINAVKANWNNFGKIDKFLLSKVLETIEIYAEKSEDFTIKFSKKD